MTRAAIINWFGPYSFEEIKEDKEWRNGIYLATGKLTSVRHFAETAAPILQIPSQALNFGQLPTRTEEMAHSEVATRRLLHLTSWVLPTRIEDGIQIRWTVFKSMDRLRTVTISFHFHWE